MAEEPTRKRRRSKWDQPAADSDNGGVSSSSSEEKVDASVSAACAAARINAMLEAKGKLVNRKPLDVSAANCVGVAKEVPPAEIEINDSEARGVLTKGPTLSEISKATGAGVSVRGRYMTPEEKTKSTADDRPLYLCIQAPNQSFINAAVQKIRTIMYNSEYGNATNLLANKPHPLITTPTPAGGPSVAPTNIHHFIQDKVFIGLDEVDESFGLTDRLQGPDGSFLSHIASTTGAKVFLRGRGSKYLEPASGRESFESLYLFISHPTSDGVLSARKLCENLIDHVKLDYDAFMMSRMRYHRPHPPHMYPPPPHHHHHGYAPPPPPPTHNHFPPPPHLHGHIMEQQPPPYIPVHQPHPLMPNMALPTSHQALHTPNHFPQVVPEQVHEPRPPYHHGYGEPPYQPVMSGPFHMSHPLPPPPPPPPPQLIDSYHPPPHVAPPTPHVAPPPPHVAPSAPNALGPMNENESVPPAVSVPVENLAYHQLPRDNIEKVLPKRTFKEQANGKDEKSSKLPSPPTSSQSVEEECRKTGSDVKLMPPPNLPPPSIKKPVTTQAAVSSTIPDSGKKRSFSPPRPPVTAATVPSHSPLSLLKRPLSSDKSLTPSTTPSAVIKATGPVPGGLSLVSYDSEDSDTDT